MTEPNGGVITLAPPCTTLKNSRTLQDSTYMNDRLTESQIVKAVAKRAAQLVTQGTIATLKDMTDTMSGDDSGLETTWEEICVQVQYQQSNYWETYEETIRGLVGQFLAKLENHELAAIWIVLDPESMRDSPGGEFFLDAEEIIDDLFKDVIREAGEYSNSRIRQYLEEDENCDDDDEDEDEDDEWENDGSDH